MIGYFPSLYPDELLYSQLARYYAKTGYLAYALVAEDLFGKSSVRPNIEFRNKYTPAILEMITREIPIETVIEKHTMFPYHARFLNKDRRKKALRALVIMDENYTNILYMLKNRQQGRYLRYCPICAVEDREKYGETYWHRNHQIIGCKVCVKHQCQLVNSNAIISSNISPTFITAEESVILSSQHSMSDNELEYRISKYITEVFQAKVDMQSDISIGEFLHSKMENTKYLSPRGKQRNILLLHKDFMEYYKSLPDNHFRELWQLQKIFTNYRLDTYEICLVAMFLNISVEELTNMRLPKKTQQELFDSKIRELHDRGLNYRQISEQLNASYDVVKTIGEGRYGKKGD